MTVDYRLLLKKYIRHVSESEGTNYIGHGIDFEGRFTKDEATELFKFNKEEADEDMAEFRRKEGLSP